MNNIGSTQNHMLVLALVLTSSLIKAQDSHHATVAHTIEQLVHGMRTADTALVKAQLHPELRLQSVKYDSAGQVIFETGSLDRWLGSIAHYPAGSLDERLYSMVIEVDPPLATAWTKYTFFFGDKLSHCGTNAFQLIQSADGWLIHQVTDTRQREGCQTTDNEHTAAVNEMVDTWHLAAAKADADTFYGSMTEDGIYIGTDASERWLRDELREWAAFAFERESAWDFKARDRSVYFTNNQTYAWWEELLDTWMGVCRGSGVAQLVDGEWKVTHYHLSVTVPNDKIEGFIELVKE